MIFIFYRIICTIKDIIYGFTKFWVKMHFDRLPLLVMLNTNKPKKSSVSVNRSRLEGGLYPKNTPRRSSVQSLGLNMPIDFTVSFSSRNKTPIKPVGLQSRMGRRPKTKKKPKKPSPNL